MPARTTFIMGRACSGKSSYVYDLIAKNEARGVRSLLIVPDRATFETEKQLSLHIGSGILYASVLSFTSLARRVLAETGEARAYLSSQGRRMLVRRTVEENSSRLTAFSRVARQVGFSEECDEIILKCKRFSITSDSLFEAAAGVKGLLAEKLTDFAIIYEKMNESMASRYIDGEDLVNSLIDRLPQSSVCGADVFIDAPEMLNEQSLRIISVLFAVAANVTITLRGNTGELYNDRRLFEPDMQAYMRLKELAREAACETALVDLSGMSYVEDAPLLWLERNLFAFPYKKYTGEAENIEVHTAGDRLHEVMAAAEAVLDAAKSGIRYRDMAVVVSDLEGYANIVKRVFSMYGIPIFMDSKRSVALHPVSELLLASMRCVEKGFSGNDFLRVIKTGLTGVPQKSCELMENHILKYALNGNRLINGFNDEDTPEEIRLAAKAVLEPLLRLKTNLGGHRTAAERISALFSYMLDMRLPEKLKDICDELMGEGYVEAARENGQVYDTIVELLDQLYVILGDDALSLAKFAAVVEEGLRAYSVGIIPATLDQVLVGDIDNTCAVRVRFLQLLGVNEGLMPKTKADNSIINDSELARLRKLGLPVWQSTDSMNRAENLRVYSSITSASERLRVSYCAEISGSTAAPSRLIGRIRDIFPKCRLTNGILTPPEGSTNETAFSHLARRLRTMIDTGEGDEALPSLYNYFSQTEEYLGALKTLEKHCFSMGTLRPLGREAALRLYGKQAVGTATRLETFNQCPFRYFMQYGMGLRERDEHQERANDRGSLIHEALDRLIEKLMAENADWGKLTEDDLAGYLMPILTELMKEHNNGIFIGTARMRAEFERTAELLLIAGSALVRQIAAGQFRPVGCELGFGRKDDAFPPLEIHADGGVRLLICGIVDRLDAYTEDECEYIRIIDYKSGNVKFDYTELANGLKLQLPLYAAAMEAVLSAEKNIKTAGFYYIHINEPSVEADDEESLREELQKAFKLNGLTLKDEKLLFAVDSVDSGWSKTVSGLRFLKDGGFSGMLADEVQMSRTLDFAKETAAKTLKAIMQGRMEISPSMCSGSSACKFCKFGSICGFDQTAGSKYRRIRRVTAEKFYAALDESAD